jgi:hypothetical protein
VKAAVNGLTGRQPALRVAEPLSGANESRQYLARVAYTSVLAAGEESIKVEVALREPLLVEPEVRPAASILLDPLTWRPAVEPVAVRCVTLVEALAEKARAALSRRDPAIRDFFDIDHAAGAMGVDFAEARLLAMVDAKLRVPGNEPVDVSRARLESLRRQAGEKLEQVLRPGDRERFDLDRAFKVVSNLAERLARASDRQGAVC